VWQGGGGVAAFQAAPLALQNWPSSTAGGRRLTSIQKFAKLQWALSEPHFGLMAKFPGSPGRLGEPAPPFHPRN
jgi:hypothetical protein